MSLLGTGYTTSARFYEGLTLPDLFMPNSIRQAGILPATETNPNLPINDATDPVIRIWKPQKK